MAIVKVKTLPTAAAVASCVSYIADPVKTAREKDQFDSAHYEDPVVRAFLFDGFVTEMDVCSTKTAARQMEGTWNRWEPRQHHGYHIIQSFAPGDPVSPEMVHEIGCRTVRQAFAGHEAVIATHLNRPHLHSHIVVNAVSAYTGKSIRYPEELQYRSVANLVRYHGDIILPDYGLIQLHPADGERWELGIPWQRRHFRGSREDVNVDIRAAAARSGNREELLAVLRSLGYETADCDGRDGIRRPGQEHYWHIESFYRPAELHVMTTQHRMETFLEAEQSRMDRHLQLSAPDDTMGGRLSKLEAAILFRAQTLLRADRILYPDLPYRLSYQLKRALAGFRIVRIEHIRTIDELENYAMDLRIERDDAREAGGSEAAAVCRGISSALRDLRSAKQAYCAAHGMTEQELDGLAMGSASVLMG